jgi:hypothetical protein
MLANEEAASMQVTLEQKRKTRQPLLPLLVLVTACAAYAGCGVTPSTGATSGVTSLASATPSRTAQPAAGCAAAPASYHGGLLLYWSPPSTPVSGGLAHPAMLCGVGFAPGEHIALSIKTTSGTTVGSPIPITADTQGSFALPYRSAFTSGCNGAQTLVAHGNQGSNATLALPHLPTDCPPP